MTGGRTTRANSMSESNMYGSAEGTCRGGVVMSPRRHDQHAAASYNVPADIYNVAAASYNVAPASR